MLTAKGKKAVSSLLALAVCVGSLPFTASAAQSNSGTAKYVDGSGNEIKASNTYSPEDIADLTMDGYEITAYSEETTYVYRSISYISGYDDRTVRPDASITRAEAAQMFYTLGSYDSSESSFSDVDKADWYYSAVSAVAGAGIISGFEDGSFLPDNNVTCAEFVVLAVKFAGLLPSIVEDSEHWADGYIDAAESAGYLSDFSDFQADEYITRAEAVSIINKVINRSTDTSGENPFTDIDESHWAYADIIAAAAYSSTDCAPLDTLTISVVDEDGTILDESTSFVVDYSAAPDIVGYSFEAVEMTITYTVTASTVTTTETTDTYDSTTNETAETDDSTTAETTGSNNDPNKTITEPTYTVTYDSNGSYGSIIMGTLPVDDNEYSKYDFVKVYDASTFSNPGYAFNGWNTEADGSGTSYAPESTFQITGDVTLYAQWRVDQY